MAPTLKCIFCKIVTKELRAVVVYEDEDTMAFLDHRPLFEGHTLLIPRTHYETLSDLPPELIEPFFTNAQMLSRAVQSAMDSVGTFVAMNNKVSQSVPHLHAHVVPRRPKDGLRGFFWPRTKYADTVRMEEVGRLVSAATKG